MSRFKKLKPEVREKVIEALRGKKYKQIDGALKDGAGEFCVLGVFCDLAAEEQVGKWDADNNFVPTGNHRSADGEFAPKAVRDWAGLSFRAADKLMQMNDGSDWEDGRKSFPELATYIEENL